ncbi:hypothetical protein ACOJBO_39920 [Rhizobium beringeri]
MAVEIPIPNRAAAERADIPSAEAARTRLRRSSLNARDIPISLIRRQQITANSDCHLNSDSAFNGRALVYAIPGKTAARFAWENRFTLFLELLLVVQICRSFTYMQS